MELPELAQQLAKGKNFATVATLMADGSPQASVVWLDTDGTHLIFNTAEGRIKPRNMRRDPRVALAIYDHEMPYRQVMVRGRVVEITEKGADAHIDQLAKKYLGVDAYPYRQPGEKRLIIKILPDKVGVMAR